MKTESLSLESFNKFYTPRSSDSIYQYWIKLMIDYKHNDFSFLQNDEEYLNNLLNLFKSCLSDALKIFESKIRDVVENHDGSPSDFIITELTLIESSFRDLKSEKLSIDNPLNNHFFQVRIKNEVFDYYDCMIKNFKANYYLFLPTQIHHEEKAKNNNNSIKTYFSIDNHKKYTIDFQILRAELLNEGFIKKTSQVASLENLFDRHSRTKFIWLGNSNELSCFIYALKERGFIKDSNFRVIAKNIFVNANGEPFKIEQPVGKNIPTTADLIKSCITNSIIKNPVSKN